ncbi:unnamed protein product, partial [Closterium sp. Naga37s-1]
FVLAMVYIALCCLVGGWLEVACWMHTGERQSARVRRLYLQALLRQEVAFFDLEACSGELINRVSSDVLLVQDAISEKVGNCIHYLSTFVCGFIVGFTSVWQLALVILAVCPLIIATGGIYAAVLTGLMTQGEKAYNEAGKIAEQVRTLCAKGASVVSTPSPHPLLVLHLPLPQQAVGQAVGQVRTVQWYVAEDREEWYLLASPDTHSTVCPPKQTTSLHHPQAVGQVRTVQSYVAEDRTVEAYGRALRDTFKLGVKGGLTKGVGLGAIYALMFASFALMFWFSGLLISRSIGNGGSILTTMFAIALGSLGLGQALPNVTAFAKGRVAAYKIFVTIARRPAIGGEEEGEAGSGGKELDAVEGRVEFEKVCFAYPARPEVPIFKDFSLAIPAGTTVALVGPSGSGKSTVVALIQRFYDPTAGAVLLDGADLRQLSLTWLRSQLGLVSQEPSLFATSILENIRYGKEDATQEEVEQAARIANAHSFVTALPHGYNTQVGERCVQLSRGQKQHIAITPEQSFANPHHLSSCPCRHATMHTQATSALDSESERVVQAALDGGLMRGRSTVVIAHRLSTIRNADKIAVVAGGRVVEQGTHEELMAHGGGFGPIIQAPKKSAGGRVVEQGTDEELMTHGGGFGPIIQAPKKSAGGRVVEQGTDEELMTHGGGVGPIIQAPKKSAGGRVVEQGTDEELMTHGGGFGPIIQAPKKSAGGRVVEQGTDEELMTHGGVGEGEGGGEDDEGRGVVSAKEGARKEGGVYANLVRLQMVSGEGAHGSSLALTNQGSALQVAGRLAADVDQSGAEADVGRKILKALSSLSESSLPRGHSGIGADVDPADVDPGEIDEEEEEEGGEGGGGKQVWGELRKVLPAPLRALLPGGKKRGEGKGENESTQQSPQKVSWWRKARMSAPEWPFTALGAAGAVMAGAFNPVYALLLIDVISALYNPDTEEMRRQVNKWAIVFTALGVLALPVHSVQNYGFGVSGEVLVKRVREKMLTAILGNEVAWFDRDANTSGAIAARLATDATLVKAAVADRIALATQNLSVIVIAFVIGFVVEWRVALVVIATFPLLIFAALMEQQFLAGFAGNQSASHAGATTIAAEAVANIRTVAAFNAQDKILALFTARLAGPLRRSFLRGQIGGAGFGLSQFFMYGSYALALWYGSTLIPDTASYGDVLKSFMVLIMTSMAIAESITFAPDIAKGSVAVRSVFKTTDRTPKILSDDPTAEVVSTVRGEIEFRSVSFAYPTRPETPVLQDFSLRAAPGKMLALVGPSGSGKSSVVALVERFYDPTAGSVRVDGEDIRSVHLKALRSFIGLVSQEPALFATTIRSNILYGQPGASEAEVVEAARAANVHGFISGLPEGYDTQVGERGVQLSGGQKQRIAIARAILKDPAVLLLDDATSALDAESEVAVQSALNRIMIGRTTIVVAHRLSTICHANCIAVLQVRGVEGGGGCEGREMLGLGMGGGWHGCAGLSSRVAG